MDINQNHSNMKLLKLNYLFAIALFISISFASCKNAEKDMENATDKIENEAKELKEEAKETTASVKKSMEEVDMKAGVYNITQVDRPPLMSSDCIKDAKPQLCSDEKVMDFIKKNVKKPSAWKNEGSFEQVLVVIEKDGSLRDIKYVASSNNEGCEACQKAAVEVVGKMNKWQPAMKDGKPVAVKMTIPVKFV